MQEEEQIKFDEMPDMFGRMFTSETVMKETSAIAQHKTYSSLYEELCDKCYPERFMEPYNATLVSAATKIYKEILQSENDEALQKDLMHRAYKELGIKFDGTKLYQYLMEYFNPRLYLKPFNPDKLEVANEYYPSIEANKRDYIALESIQAKGQWFIDAIIEEQAAECETQEQEEVMAFDSEVVEKNEREDAIRRFNMDQSFLEEIRNSLGIYHYKKYIQENYGGYIDVDNL